MIKEIFEKNHTDKTKYASFYEKIFSEKFDLILEIGAFKGGGMRSYKEIMPNARVIGIEANEGLRNESPELEIYVGNQKDAMFLINLIEKIGKPDLIIDDGGHMMSEQTTSFSILFSKLKNGGTYIIEDLETCYMDHWQDQGYKTTDLILDIIDNLNLEDFIESIYMEKNIISIKRK